MRQPINCSNSKIVWVRTVISDQQDTFIVVCYRPNMTNTITIQALATCFKGLLAVRHENVILADDLKFPGWHWESKEIWPGTSYVLLYKEFQSLLDEYGLTQHVITPTSLTNTLNLITSNIPKRINRTIVIPGINNHLIAFTDISLKINRKREAQHTVWLYN